MLQFMGLQRLGHDRVTELKLKDTTIELVAYEEHILTSHIFESWEVQDQGECTFSVW